MSYHTLAGFILAQLGRVPKEGHAAVYQGWRFEVVDMDGPLHRQGAGASRISTQGMKPDKSA